LDIHLEYKVRSTTRVGRTLDTRPSITTVARGFCTSAPVPVTNATRRRPIRFQSRGHASDGTDGLGGLLRGDACGSLQTH
jgi:hypothetical protein